MNMVLILFTLFSIMCFLSRSFMLIIILMEMMGFIMVWCVSYYFDCYSNSDYFIMIIFSVLVMEGVIALSGLISIVSFSGSDYLIFNSLLKL